MTNRPKNGLPRPEKRLTRLSPGQPRWARRGRGGPPSPLPVEPSDLSAGHRPEPVVRARCSPPPIRCPLSPQKLGLKHARRKGTRPTTPRKSSSSKHNGPGVRSQRRHAIAAEAPLPGKRALASQVPHPANAHASGRIAGMPREPVELALLAAADLLPPGTSVLAACSGGPDSVALTSALAACAGELGIRLAVGHVDHGLRPQSGADATHVQGLAGRLGLPFHVRRLEALDVSELGLEGAAREARYAALAQLAAHAGADRVATAHTRRDQAETVLLRLARGGGAGALAGIRRSRALTGA